MNRIRIAIVLLLVVSKINAQDFPSRLWHEGRIVTSDRDTLRGDLMYNLETNTVQVQVSKKVLKTFSSKKTFFFEIYDVGVNNFRQFYSIPFKVSQNYKTPIFFEVLYEGSMTLLVRERIVLENDPYAPTYNGSRSTTRERLAYTYYFVDKKGNMKEFSSGKKSDLLNILIKSPEKMKKFIKSNRLHTDRMRDLVRITSFYNSI